MLKIEALADAVAYCNSYHEPDSQAYVLRNPGLLKAKSLRALGSATDDSIRIFPTAQGGYRALTLNITQKCERYPKSSLRENLAYFGVNLDTAIDFLQRALGDSAISEQTKLAFFLE